MTKLKPGKAIALYENMVKIRLLEEEIAKRYVEQEMRCPVHLSIGQEAAATGVCLTLEKTDKVFSTHRSHAHYISKGGNLNKMLAEIYGKETGCVAGRGGSMHIMDPDVGMIASIPIVGSCIPLAVGSALADSLDEVKNVSVAYLGDASVEEGVFHESANFAKLKNLPVLFVCENNLYSVYTHLNRRQPDRPITSLPEAHNIPTYHCDGNNVEAVHFVVLEALERARKKKGPSFLLLDTYRWREHCGPNFDNNLGYRTEEEFSDWQKNDPVHCYKNYLLTKKLITKDFDIAMKKTILTEIANAFEFAKISPYPHASAAAKRVYA